MRLLNNARKKFQQLDKDLDGVLRGAELNELSDWVLNSYRPNGAKITTEEITMMKSTIMEKFRKRVSLPAKEGGITMEEMVVIFEETMEVININIVAPISYSNFGQFVIEKAVG
jgi:hypothetical protein